MGITLLDTKVIQGAYIDRTKNMAKGILTKFDQVEKEVYWRAASSHSGNSAAPADGDAELQGFNLNKNEVGVNDIQIIQVKLQIKSNLRLLLKHTESGTTIGQPESVHNSVEFHSIQFERYTQMPHDLSAFKKKMLEQAKTNKTLAKQIAEEELFNPWVVSDFDNSMDGNRHVKKKEEINDWIKKSYI